MTTRSYFEISPSWQPERNGIQSDVADITVRLGNDILSRVVDVKQGTSRDGFRASATAVGLWFADNWWRLRCETIADPRFPSADWRVSHELNSAVGGVVWPPIMIYSAGERIIVAPSAVSRPTDGPQQFLEVAAGAVWADHYEQSVDQFLEAVIGQCANAVDGKALADICRQIRTERTDPELAGWRRLEACLGFNPDEAPEKIVKRFTELERIVGEGGVEEAAFAQQGEGSAATLASALDAARASDLTVKIDVASVPGRPGIRAGTPWQFAEAAAQHLRRVIGVPHGPLKGSHFADLFQARWDTLKAATATARNLPYGASLRQQNDGSRLALQTTKPHDRRFELARMLGDAIWMKDGNFGLVSHARSDRQKFQRAFAQSLLCPFEDLLQDIDAQAPTSEQLESASRRFHVHANVVRNLLVYKGVLNADSLAERLETI